LLDGAPELSWERLGDVDNIIIVQGAVMQPDGAIYPTYGAGDCCVGAARVITGELLEALRTPDDLPRVRTAPQATLKSRSRLARRDPSG
jgi:hypothetical protein